MRTDLDIMLCDCNMSDFVALPCFMIMIRIGLGKKKDKFFNNFKLFPSSMFF